MADTLEDMESLAALSKTLADNPKTRNQFLNLVKQASPDTPIPEIDILNSVHLAAQPLVNKVKSLEDQLQKRDFEASVREQRDILIKNGIREDQVKEVEQMMIDKKIGDYGTAAEHFRMQQQSAPTTPANFSSPMTTPTIPKDFHGDVNAWARSQAHDAVNDIIKARSR